jgi:hypothetical protein
MHESLNFINDASADARKAVFKSSSARLHTIVTHAPSQVFGEASFDLQSVLQMHYVSRAKHSRASSPSASSKGSVIVRLPPGMGGDMQLYEVRRRLPGARCR